MKTEKQKKVDFARKLYMQYDAEGKKQFSLRQIVDKILTKFDSKVSYQTIKNWSEKYEWDKLNADIKQQSIKKAEDSKFSTEERIIEAKSDSTAKDYKNADNLANIGLNVINAMYKDEKTRKLITIRDALAAIKTGTEIKFRIADIPDYEKSKLTDNDRDAIIKRLTNG